MVLQAYIDESIGSDGTFVLGGYVSTSERWAKFSIEWERLLKPFGVLKENSKAYHFKFSEMDIDGRRDRIPFFEAVARENTILAISCAFNIKDLKTATRRVIAPGYIIDLSVFNDPFRFAFRALLDKLHGHRNMFANLVDPEAPIDFIFDTQTRTQKKIIADWGAYMDSRSEQRRRLYGKSPRFESDEVCLPLQAADLWVGKMRLAYEQGTLHGLLSPLEQSRFRYPCIKMDWNEDQIVADLINAANAELGIGAFDALVGRVPLTNIS